MARCFGLLGHPVAHSRSPAMHDAAFADLGLPHRYFTFDVAPERLVAALEGARALGLGGLNVTVPHKQAAAAWVDTQAPEVQRTGALNTVVFRGHHATGHSTDGTGFLAALGELSDAAFDHVVVLGTGGAGVSVVDALVHRTGVARVDWISRTPRTHVPDRVVAHGWDALDQALAGADLLVNATSVGMRGGPPAFPQEPALARMRPDACVVDLVYPRSVGGLLDRADMLGLRTQDGTAMLLHQGIAALELWLGERLGARTRAAMRDAVLRYT